MRASATPAIPRPATMPSQAGRLSARGWSVRSCWCVTDSLHVVSVGIDHKCPVVVWVVARPQTGGTIVLAAGGERRAMKCVNRRTILGGEGDVQRVIDCAICANPEIRLPARPKSSRRVPGLGLIGLDFLDLRITERCQ